MSNTWSPTCGLIVYDKRSRTVRTCRRRARWIVEMPVGQELFGLCNPHLSRWREASAGLYRAKARAA